MTPQSPHSSGRGLPAYQALGLGCLYASGYYLPLLGAGSYTLTNLAAQVVGPSLVAIAAAGATAWLAATVPGRGGQLRTGLAIAAIAGLMLMAAAGLFSAAGFSVWGLALTLGHHGMSLNGTRLFRVAFLVVPAGLALTLAWTFRTRYEALLRFLGLLGYGFAILAAVRVGQFAHHLSPTTTRSPPSVYQAARHERRVIWIVFDEMDYQQTLGSPVALAHMPNLAALQGMAVSAEQAFSPGKDTEYSIPALLMGWPIRGTRFTSDGALSLTRLDGTEGTVGTQGSIFAQLPSGPDSAAILGYYHPYCKLFPEVSTCFAIYEGNAGRWYDGLLFLSEYAMSLARWVPHAMKHLPTGVLVRWAPMYRISDQSMHDLPTLLRRKDKALLYIHLNIPHPPAEYAERSLGLPTSTDDREHYRQNLPLVDHVLGQVLSLIGRDSPTQETLLIVTSDHWHRMDSPSVPRPIPLLLWRPGMSEGLRIAQPISTVYTGRYILEYLNGRLKEPADWVHWWEAQPFHDSWIQFNFKQ